jgi:arginine repressor
MEKRVDKHSNKAKNTIIMGDFNFPFINWKKRDDFVYIDSLTGGTNISKEDKNQAELLEQWMVKHTFMQVVTEKTRGKNILDLVITNISEQIIRLYTIPTDTNISDHKFIRIDLNLPTKQQISRETESEGIFSNLNTYSRNINWLNINKKISKTNWEGYLGDDSPEDILNKIESKIKGIIQEHIPKKGMKRKRNKYEQRIRILYKKRRRFIKQLLKSKSEKKKEEVETKLLKNDLELQKVIRTKKYEEEIYATEKISTNSKFFFTYANRKRNKVSKIGPLKNKDQEYVTNPKKMSEILNEQFKNSFTKSKPEWKIDNLEAHFSVELTEGDIQNKTTLYNFEFTEEDMINAISKVKESSAAGPDSRSAKFLKECKTTIAKPLCILWRKSLDTGIIPRELKKRQYCSNF